MSKGSTQLAKKQKYPKHTVILS